MTRVSKKYIKKEHADQIDTSVLQVTELITASLSNINHTGVKNLVLPIKVDDQNIKEVNKKGSCWLD